MSSSRGVIGLSWLVQTLITLVILIIVVAVASIFIVRINYVQGHELAVKEAWTGVVQEPGPDGSLQTKVFGPKKRFYCPIITSYIRYDMRRHHYVLGNTDDLTENIKKDVNGPALLINAQGGQEVKVSVDVVWRYSDSHIGILHRDVRNDVGLAEAKILDNPIRRLTQDLVTDKQALDVYYGAGLQKLQVEFQKGLQADQSIARAGLIIESAVLYTTLHPDYVLQIREKVVAEQRKEAQRSIEQANIQEALAVKAFAEIEKNKVVIEAEGAKQKDILQAEGAKQKAVLAAEADREKQRLEGEGLELRKVSEAKGVEALMLAQAKGEEALKLAKYDGTAGQRQTSVMIAEKVADRVAGMLRGVSILPDKAFMSIAQGVTGGSVLQPVIDIAPRQIDIPSE